jgi:hypothetical protein
MSAVAGITTGGGEERQDAMTRSSSIALAILMSLSFVTQAVAEDRRDGREPDHRSVDRGRHEEWHDRDIHRFREHDFDRWRAGGWHRGFHNGREGWWWVVGGAWYYYPAPVYPYPDPYRPPVIAGPPPAAAPARAYYYYCPNPQGYYPYLPNCPVGWQAIPAP